MERIIPPMANGNNCRHCEASICQNPAVAIALTEICGNSIGGEPMSNRPIAQDAKMIGPSVQGLPINTPAINATRFIRPTSNNNPARIM